MCEGDNHSLRKCDRLIGEPLVTPNPRKRKAAALSGNRGPRPCISSLNGMHIAGLDSSLAVVPTGDAALCEAYRDAFFKEYIPSGVAVTKWAYDRAGHQANQFVATNGGASLPFFLMNIGRSQHHLLRREH